MLSVFRDFLENVATAWEKVTNEQKNRLARHMFDVVWTSNNKVVAVRPRAELGPFFQVSEHCQEKVCLATPTGFKASGKTSPMPGIRSTPRTKSTPPILTQSIQNCRLCCMVN